MKRARNGSGKKQGRNRKLILGIRLEKDELSRLEDAAERAGDPTSTYGRKLILRGLELQSAA